MKTWMFETLFMSNYWVFNQESLFQYQELDGDNNKFIGPYIWPST